MNEEIINNEIENENIEINDEQMENISGGSYVLGGITPSNDSKEITDDIRVGFN